MVMPKLLAQRVLEPLLKMQESVRLVCQEAAPGDLLADLSVHKLDLVLADAPLSPALNIRAYNHLLGESGLSFFATHKKARKYGCREIRRACYRAHRRHQGTLLCHFCRAPHQAPGSFRNHRVSPHRIVYILLKQAHVHPGLPVPALPWNTHSTCSSPVSIAPFFIA
jgi:hypothetical protein